MSELKDDAEDRVVKELSKHLPIEAARAWGWFCHASLSHDSTQYQLTDLIDAAVVLSDLDHRRAISWYSILADPDLVLLYDSWGYEPAEVSDLILGCCPRLLGSGEVFAADRERLDHLEGFLRARIPACRIRSYGVLGMSLQRALADYEPQAGATDLDQKLQSMATSVHPIPGLAPLRWKGTP